jgi:hypothetical protein
LATCGWPVKPGALATKTTTLMIRTIASSSPASSATAASPLSTAIRAQAFASSGLTSAPTRPVDRSWPSTRGS